MGKLLQEDINVKCHSLKDGCLLFEQPVREQTEEAHGKNCIVIGISRVLNRLYFITGYEIDSIIEIHDLLFKGMILEFHVHLRNLLQCLIAILQL